jgi:hypothetical protein
MSRGFAGMVVVTTNSFSPRNDWRFPHIPIKRTSEGQRPSEATLQFDSG